MKTCRYQQLNAPCQVVVDLHNIPFKVRQLKGRFHLQTIKSFLIFPDNKIRLLHYIETGGMPRDTKMILNYGSLALRLN